MANCIVSTLFPMNLLSFSDRLQTAIGASDLNQSALAKKVGLSRAAINQVVNGTSKGMKPDNLVAVARALNVRIEWLATGEEPMRPEVITAADKEALRYLHAMPSRRRENMIAVIRDAANSV